jgi:DNA-binding LacI/PurR family transcriptional regulator
VAAPTVQAGAAAVDALLAHLAPVEAPAPPPSVRELPATLVVRDSTAAPQPLALTTEGAV